MLIYSLQIYDFISFPLISYLKYDKQCNEKFHWKRNFFIIDYAYKQKKCSWAEIFLYFYDFLKLFIGRSKSPKSRSSSQERSSSANSNMFVRANSLKAWKEEQDRIKAEEDEKERAQSAKRARSAQKRVRSHDARLEFIPYCQ